MSLSSCGVKGEHPVRKAAIGLGANIDGPLENLRDAVQALGLVPGLRVIRCSGVYKTAPMGGVEQPDFYNGAAEVETSLSPNALLGVCLGVEAAMGRRRLQKNGPRCIDLDLLFFEGTTLQSTELTLPHPRMAQRLFVLRPLWELYPGGEALGFSLPSVSGLHERVEYQGALSFAR